MRFDTFGVVRTVYDQDDSSAVVDNELGYKAVVAIEFSSVASDFDVFISDIPNHKPIKEIVDQSIISYHLGRSPLY